jgi:hypothetical protein
MIGILARFIEDNLEFIDFNHGDLEIDWAGSPGIIDMPQLDLGDHIVWLVEKGTINVVDFSTLMWSHYRRVLELMVQI